MIYLLIKFIWYSWKTAIDDNNSFNLTVVDSLEMLYQVRVLADKILLVTTICFGVKYLKFSSFTVCQSFLFTVNIKHTLNKFFKHFGFMVFTNEPTKNA